MKATEERVRAWASLAMTVIVGVGLPLLALGVVVAAIAVLAGIVRVSLTWGLGG
jgi:uncharacterized membrane protein